jgi:hypothetical protein
MRELMGGDGVVAGLLGEGGGGGEVAAEREEDAGLGAEWHFGWSGLS